MANTIGGVAAASVYGGTSLSTGAFSANPSAGECVVVLVIWQAGGSEAPSSVLDNASGNIYTPCGAQIDGGGTMHGLAYYAKNVNTTTGFAVDVAMSGSVDSILIGAAVVTGADTSDPLGLYGGQGQTSPGTGTDAVSTGSLGTPAQDGHAVVAFTGAHSAIDNLTAGTGYTTGPTASNPECRLESLVQTTAAGVTATFTSDGTGTLYFMTLAVTVKAAGGGGGGFMPDPFLKIRFKAA